MTLSPKTPTTTQHPLQKDKQQQPDEHASSNKKESSPLPNRMLTLTKGDLFSILMTFLFYYQPGVDRKAVYVWICETLHGGDYAKMGQFSITYIHKTIDWGSLIIMLILYRLQIPFIERFKTNPHEPWPWNHPDAKYREEYKQQTKTAAWYAFRLHVFTVSLAFFTPGYQGPNHPDDIPAWWVTFLQCMVATFIFDAGFYWGHRIQHSRLLYKWHKQHHEYKDSSILTAFYNHPLDIILTIIIPAGLPPVLMNMHLYSVWLLMIPLNLSNIFQHCGYSAPWDLNPLLWQPLSTDAAARHEQHHRTAHVNFGATYSHWDRLMGTYKYPEALKTTEQRVQRADRRKLEEQHEEGDGWMWGEGKPKPDSADQIKKKD